MLSNSGVKEDSRVPCTARRSDQSILKEINPQYSLEGLTLKLKLQYCGHRMGRAHSVEETLMLGKTGGRRRRGQLRIEWHHQLIGPKFKQMVRDREAWDAAVHVVTKSQTR